MPKPRIHTGEERGGLRLVGGQAVLTADSGIDAEMEFYGPLFLRLRTEVKHTGRLTRHVGFQSRLGEGKHLHFLGIEVEKIENIPAGMVAWELSESRWAIWEEHAGKHVSMGEERITWKWFDQSSGPGGRLTGEFTAPGPMRDGGKTFPRPRDYWMSMHSYWSRAEIEVSDDSVSLVSYDPTWPKRYEEFADWLRESLGPDVALRLEHYGSTSIPGMPAKPIIDVLVEIPSFPDAKRRAIPRLNRVEWEYCWYSGHLVFIRRAMLMGPRTHHVHMAPRGHAVWKGLAFRDYLRSHPQDASRYAALKNELAAAHRNDRERYTTAKTAFIREIGSKDLLGGGANSRSG